MLEIFRWLFSPVEEVDKRDKLERWKDQLKEYDRLGLKELARGLRQSIDAHEKASRRMAVK